MWGRRNFRRAQKGAKFVMRGEDTKLPLGVTILLILNIFLAIWLTQYIPTLKDYINSYEQTGMVVDVRAARSEDSGFFNMVRGQKLIEVLYRDDKGMEQTTNIYVKRELATPLFAPVRFRVSRKTGQILRVQPIVAEYYAIIVIALDFGFLITSCHFIGKPPKKKCSI